MTLIWVLGTLTLFSLCLLIWQMVAGWQFPLHKRTPPMCAADLPSVTLFKPVKGWDCEADDCMRSWFNQEYGAAVEILFGVDSRSDPICQLIENLIDLHPHISAKLIVCPRGDLTNGKVAKLAHLSSLASHEVWIVSDADVKVPSDFLEQTISLLVERDAGMVHCLYRMKAPRILAMQWEAVGVNVDFWSQVLQARQLRPLDFALGATMVTTRRHIAAVGGFAAVGHFLADDYYLGNRIARAGHELILSPVVVTCHEPAMSWREAWKHQLRWARTIRSCKPLPYFLSILSNTTLWSLLFWLVLVSSSGNLLGPGLSTFACCCFLRIGSAIALQHRLTGSPPEGIWAGMILIKDLLQVAVWALAFLGNRIDWRGEEFRVYRDGQLILPETSSSPQKVGAG